MLAARPGERSAAFVVWSPRVARAEPRSRRPPKGLLSGSVGHWLTGAARGRCRRSRRPSPRARPRPRVRVDRLHGARRNLHDPRDHARRRARCPRRRRPSSSRPADRSCRRRERIVKPLLLDLVRDAAARPVWVVPLRTATCVALRSTRGSEAPGAARRPAAARASPIALSGRRRVAAAGQQQHEHDRDDEHAGGAADDQADARAAWRGARRRTGGRGRPRRRRARSRGCRSGSGTGRAASDSCVSWPPAPLASAGLRPAVAAWRAAAAGACGGGSRRGGTGGPAPRRGAGRGGRRPGAAGAARVRRDAGDQRLAGAAELAGRPADERRGGRRRGGRCWNFCMTVAAAALRAASACCAAAVCGAPGWAAGGGIAAGAGIGWATTRRCASACTRCGELGVALGRAAGPLAQALDLARLREVQQREHAEPDDRGVAGSTPRSARSGRRA